MRWKFKQLHIMPPNKRLGQPTICTYVHFEKAIARSELMTFNEPKLVELRQHCKVLEARFIREKVLLIVYAY